MRPPFQPKCLTSIFKSAFLLLLLLALPLAHARAQTQITTGVIQGTVTDEQGAIVPGASVEVKNVETNLTRTLTTDEDGRFVFLQLPPGRYTLTVSKQGFATLEQEEFALTVGQAVTLDLKMKVSGVNETITVSAVQTVDTASTQASTTINERSVAQPPRPRPQVRRPADADAGRLHHAGAGRRRDQLRRPARRLQQHQPRRRRLQQRLLRRAGRRPARRHRHPARRRQGVSGHRHRRDRRVRAHRGRRRQRHHQVGHQRVPRLALPLPAARSPDRQHLRRQAPDRLSPRAVRRQRRRADQEGQGFLLRRLRADFREPDARQPQRADRRHALPGLRADHSWPTKR